jgi:hypothetical protein
MGASRGSGRSCRAFQPAEQRRVGGATPCQTSSISSTGVPDHSASATRASRAETPTRRPPGDQLDQREPPAGIERVEPAGDQRGDLRLRRGLKRLHDVGQRRRRGVDAGAAAARSARRSRPGRRHSRRTGARAPGRCASRPARGSSPAWRRRSAVPRSARRGRCRARGRAVSANHCRSRASLALRPGVKTRRSSSSAKAGRLMPRPRRAPRPRPPRRGRRDAARGRGCP